MHDQFNSWSIQFSSEVLTSYSSNWFTLLLLCTSASLVLYCDRFDRGSRQREDSILLYVESLRDKVTSDEDAWRPLIRYGIIIWFCGDIPSCRMPWNIWNWLYYQLFLEGAVFLKRRKMPKCLMLSDCIWPGSCSWQPTTCLRWNNGKHHSSMLLRQTLQLSRNASTTLMHVTAI